jgi:hypothetical protein
MTNHSDDSNGFATLFDGNNLNDWQMAGQGKFVIVQGGTVLKKDLEVDCIISLSYHQRISHFSNFDSS